MASDVLERISTGSLLFSIISLSSCALIIILIFFQKQLRSITYTFLLFIFGSEILNNIGNIIIDNNNNDNNKEALNITALCFISCSDMFTNILFVFFTYCSIKLIKETNKLIKKKVSRFIIISAIISVIYMGVFLTLAFTLISEQDREIIDVRFRGFYSKDKEFPTIFYIMSSVHMFLIILLSIFSLRNTCVVLTFMADKQKSDMANAKSIARLRKILGRYPTICILYWAFLIPRLIFVSTSGETHILRDALYFISESFFRVRGFLIFLNTFRSSKIQMIIYRIIELKIKHDCLLNLKILKRRTKSRSKIKAELESPLTE